MLAIRGSYRLRLHAAAENHFFGGAFLKGGFRLRGGKYRNELISSLTVREKIEECTEMMILKEWFNTNKCARAD